MFGTEQTVGSRRRKLPAEAQAGFARRSAASAILLGRARVDASVRVFHPIGSYLGLKLETVSRLFSRFQGEGFIQVQGRALKLLDPTALKRIAGQHA